MHQQQATPRRAGQQIKFEFQPSVQTRPGSIDTSQHQLIQPHAPPKGSWKCRPVNLSLAIINPFAKMVVRREERVMFKTPTTEVELRADRRRAWKKRMDKFQPETTAKEVVKLRSIHGGHRGAIVPAHDDSALDTETVPSHGATTVCLAKYVSTKESAKISWPIGYTVYRENLADLLAQKQSLAPYQELTLLRNQHQLVRPSLEQLSYICSNAEQSDDVIIRGFEALCHYVSQCRDSAHDAVRRKRLTLDRLTRERVRDLNRTLAAHQCIINSYPQELSAKDEIMCELSLEMSLAQQLKGLVRTIDRPIGLAQLLQQDDFMAARCLFRTTASFDADYWMSHSPVFPIDLWHKMAISEFTTVVRRLTTKLTAMQQALEERALRRLQQRYAQPGQHVEINRQLEMVRDWTRDMSTLRHLVQHVYAQQLTLAHDSQLD